MSYFLVDIFVIIIGNDSCKIPLKILFLACNLHRISGLETMEIHQRHKRFDLLRKTPSLHEFIEENNIDEVKKYIKKFPLEKHGSLNGKSALVASYEQGRFEVSRILLSNGFIFRPDELLHEIPRFTEDVKALHTSILNCDRNGIVSFASNYPNEKFAVSTHNLSAAAFALKSDSDGKCELYEFLLSHGFRLSEHENLDEILNQASTHNSSFKKERMRDVHKKFIKGHTVQHLEVLRAHAKLSHTTSEHELRTFSMLIDAALWDLHEISWIQPVLKVASTSESLTMVFDFEKDSVEQMDPTKSSKVKGTVYPSAAYIYIGAKKLLTESQRNEVLGVMAHELTHFAMKCIFNNNCKPYKSENENSSDEDNKRSSNHDIENYCNAFEYCERFKEHEQLVSFVFDLYSIDVQHCELIVRVPQMLALYRNHEDQAKLEGCKETYSPLFKYFEETVLRRLNKSLPSLEAKNKITELNALGSTLWKLENSEISLKPESSKIDNVRADQKLLRISTNFCEVTMISIFKSIKSNRNKYIFMEQRWLQGPRIFKLTVEALNLTTRPILIVDCEGHDWIGIADELLRNGIKSRVVFVTNDSSEPIKLQKFVLYSKIQHSLSHLTRESVRSLYKATVCFQGEIVKLKDILDESSLDEDFPLKLQQKNIIEIGKHINHSSKPFVPRNFIPMTDPENCREIDEILDASPNYEAILIVDQPGMGKSTVLEMITKRIKGKSPNKWIVLVHLKEYASEYQYDGDESETTFNSSLRISTFFCEKIMKLTSFESKIFKHLFRINRVVFLLDGFDEIVPSFNNFILNLIRGIRSVSNNQLWISSRPHLKTDLIQTLDPKVFSLKPFSEECQNKFFRLKFKHMNFDENSWSDTIEKIENSLRPLGDVASNPLLLDMIASLSVEHPKSEYNSENIYSILESFLLKMVEKCMEKGCEAKASVSKQVGERSIKQFFQKNAFQVVFPFTGENETLDILVRKILNNWFEFPANFGVHDLVRTGVMYYDESGKYHFVHQIFAEFYVSKFVYEISFTRKYHSGHKPMELIIELIMELLMNDSQYNLILTFIDHAMNDFKFIRHFDSDSYPDDFRDSIIETRRKGEQQEFFAAFSHSANDYFRKYINIFQIFAFHLKDEINFLELFKVSTTSSESSVEKFVACVKNLHNNSAKEVLLRKLNDNDCILLEALRTDISVFQMLVAKTNLTKLEIANILLLENSKKENFLHWVVLNHKSFSTYFEFIKQFLDQDQLSSLLSSESYLNSFPPFFETI